MKLNLENIHSPCQQCFNHGHLYSSYDDKCQSCEYNIAIKLLKVVLKDNDYCTLCKNRVNLGDGCYDCKVNGNNDCICDVENDFLIDWEYAFKDYGIQLDKISK